LPITAENTMASVPMALFRTGKKYFRAGHFGPGRRSLQGLEVIIRPLEEHHWNERKKNVILSATLTSLSLSLNVTLTSKLTTQLNICSKISTVPTLVIK